MTAIGKQKDREEAAAMIRKYADLIESGDLRALCVSAMRSPDQTEHSSTDNITAYWFETGHWQGLIASLELSKFNVIMDD